MTSNNKTADIIDFILAEQEKSKSEIQKQITDNKTILDDESFFLDNKPEGIMTKEQFKELLQRVSKIELQAFKTFLDVMNDNRKINTSSFAQTDKKGQEYYWLKIYGKNGATEFKVSSFPGLDRLMQGYLYNLYNVTLTLEGLYTEAIRVA
ncbi:hypothetical protein [Pedobacter immunditicola]|uniref:hypothetical protein n=1 Tax=Pedobacter immunditicola TaxID=3133440 RepID=UPI0030A6C66E